MKKTHHILVLILILTSFVWQSGRAQDCDSLVPVFDVDLSADPNSTWISPLVIREGNCCGTTDPDRCIAFVITLHPDAEGIIFDVCEGAISSGSMFYQVNCGPQVAVGASICLESVGPHYLTFCKPGNNENGYCITSVSQPTVDPLPDLGYGCSAAITTAGFATSGMTWNSISPGGPGMYNDLLSCTSGCGNAEITNTSEIPLSIVYEICGTPLGGCTIMDTCILLDINLLPPLNVSVYPTQPFICFGETQTLVTVNTSGGSGIYTINWSDGTQGPENYTGPGQSWVQVTDTESCEPSQFDFFVESLSAQPLANAGNDMILCNNPPPAVLNASASGDYSTLEWSGGDGVFTNGDGTLDNAYLPTAAEITNGVTLYLTVYPDIDCPSHTDTVHIQFGMSEITVTPEITNISCADYTDGSISINITPSGEYAAQWLGTLVSGNEITGLQAGLHSVMIVDQAGCDTTVSFLVSEPEPLAISVTTDNVTCFGQDDGTIFMAASGGTGLTFGTITGDQYFTTGFIANSVEAGTYYLAVTDQNGCTATATAQITQPAEIYAVISGQDQICPGQAVTLNVNASGGTGTLDYQWSQGLPNQATQVVSPSSTTVYSVLLTDDNGCSFGPMTAEVEIMSLTSGLSVTGGGGICPGQSTQVSSQFIGEFGPYTYYWNQGLGNSQGTFTVYPSVDTWFSFSVFDICGNSLVDSVFVEVYEVPQIVLPGNYAQGCSPFTVHFGEELQDLEGMSFNWNFGDGIFSFSENPVHTYNIAGSYNISVLVTTPDGCIVESQGNSTVNVFSSPEAGIIANPTITTLDDPTILFMSTVEGDVSNQWDFGNDEYSIANEIEYTYSDTGTYYVTLSVVNEYGCEDQAGIYVIVLPVYELIIPNVFTPDPDNPGDGYFDASQMDNNIFYPFTEYVKDFELLIFNRWGELIFESTELQKGWNGYYRGELCQQDVYTYKVTVEHTDGRVQSKIGDITLLR